MGILTDYNAWSSQRQELYIRENDDRGPGVTPSEWERHDDEGLLFAAQACDALERACKLLEGWLRIVHASHAPTDSFLKEVR